jgi:hypothetical protein
MSKRKNPIEPSKLIVSEPAVQGGNLVKEFIMSCPPHPPEWGPAMQEAVKEGLSAAGFTVARCDLLMTHPVVAVKLRGPEEVEIREMRRCIRKLAKDLGHRAPSGGMAITGRAGEFDGAFVMEPEFGVFQPCPES